MMKREDPFGYQCAARDIRHALKATFEKPGDFDIELVAGTRQVRLTAPDGTMLEGVIDVIIFGDGDRLSE